MNTVVSEFIPTSNTFVYDEHYDDHCFGSHDQSGQSRTNSTSYCGSKITFPCILGGTSHDNHLRVGNNIILCFIVKK